MDKEKIKIEVNEIKILLDEFVADGKLDGDVAKDMLGQFIRSSISKEVNEIMEVV